MAKWLYPFFIANMIKLRKNIKEEVLFIDCLDSQSLQVLNNLFDTHYSRGKVHRDIKVKRAEKEPGFWDKLVRQRSGVQQ